jgi:hypothetical protein
VVVVAIALNRKKRATKALVLQKCKTKVLKRYKKGKKPWQYIGGALAFLVAISAAISGEM